jgi:hypothetical protein
LRQIYWHAKGCETKIDRISMLRVLLIIRKKVRKVKSKFDN